MTTTRDEIPQYLRQYTTEQEYALYTPMDHASWRYIMRVSREFFKDHAHEKYLTGLKETGISTDSIPKIEDMDRCLRKFGWKTVAVSGFIPPAIFMEFQSLGILPIACDMRQIGHLAYTPAPDIVHEAAGHAPILADPEYAAYLRNYGQVARRAIYTDKDMAVFHAIRRLSEVKERPDATKPEIEQAQNMLEHAVADNTYVSEATYLARMNWWTVEYGLVGDPSANPLIYGAGLLSSVGESQSCLEEKVRKIPFTLDCINTSYDITRPQPHLFVTPDFPTLTLALREFEASMAFRVGGIKALAKAKIANATTTTELESGIQISGTLHDFLLDSSGKPFYLFYSGPCQLSASDQELSAQGPVRHPQGYSTPIGRLAKIGRTLSELSEYDLDKLGLRIGAKVQIEYESGIVLEGTLKTKIEHQHRPLVLTFTGCTVKLGTQVLYRPEWGEFDLAGGATVTSVFGGAADRQRYLEAIGEASHPQVRQKTNLTDENQALNALYQKVKDLRNSKRVTPAALEDICDALSERYPNDWLLRLELIELGHRLQIRSRCATTCRQHLDTIANASTEISTLIQRGLELLK